MAQTSAFNELLDAVERLSADEQQALASILHRRLAMLGRARVADDVRKSQQEFGEGACQPASVDDLMGEILE